MQVIVAMHRAHGGAHLPNGSFEADVSLYSRLAYAVDRREDFMNGTAVFMSKKLPR